MQKNRRKNENELSGAAVAGYDAELGAHEMAVAGDENSLRLPSLSPEKLKNRLAEPLIRLFDRIFGTDECVGRRAALLYSAKAAGAAFFALLVASSDITLSSCPLGLALLAAVTRFVPFVYIGCLAGALVSGVTPIPYMIAMTAVFLLRLVLSAGPGAEASPRGRKVRAGNVKLELPRRLSPEKGFFKDSAAAKTAICCGCALIPAIYRIVAGGFIYYDLFGAILLVTLSPFFTFMYSGFFTEGEKKGAYFEAGAAAMLFSAITVLRGVTVATLSCDLLVAYLVTLIISKIGGGLRAGITGLVCGIAVAPATAPMLGVVGIFSSLMWKYSLSAALGVSGVVGVLFAVFTGGLGEVLRLLPEFIVASAAALPIFHTGVLSKLGFLSFGQDRAGSGDRSPEAEELGKELGTDRISALSASLSELSETFRELSEKTGKPGQEELLRMCESICLRHCATCGMKSVCADRGTANGRISPLLDSISGQLYAKGRASGAAIPELPEYRCLRLDSIIEEANRACAGLMREASRGNRTGAFALDYRAISGLLDSALEESRQETAFSPALSDRLRSALAKSEFSARHIGVYGSRCHRVMATGINLPRTKVRTATLHRLIENALNEPLTEPEFSIEDGEVRLSMRSRRKFSVTSASVGRRKASSDVSGDSRSVMETDRDYCYSMILDGAGSGRDAALTSRIGLLILSKMLAAGNSRSAALGLAGAFLCSAEQETSTTVDLCEIDLITGRAVFMKCGSAPSYIRRDGRLFKLEAHTFPIGIIEDSEAEEIAVTLEAGDHIIMFSDGVAQSHEDSPWLFTVLDEEWDNDPGVMAGRILSAACRANGGKDDATVTVLRVDVGAH